MDKQLRFRFSERDYMYNLVLLNSDYITAKEINSILDEHGWQDLTFIITENASGFRTKILSNLYDKEVQLDQLSQPSYDFYIRKIEELSYNKAITEIEKIRTILYSKNNVGGKNERDRKTYLHNTSSNNRLEKIAQ